MSLCKKLLALNCPRVFSPICSLVFFVEWLNHSLPLQFHPYQWRAPHEPSQTSPLFLLALPLPWRLWRVLTTWQDLSETRNASFLSHRHTYTDTSSINSIKRNTLLFSFLHSPSASSSSSQCNIYFPGFLLSPMLQTALFPLCLVGLTAFTQVCTATVKSGGK